jgi:hypothetical protein
MKRDGEETDMAKIKYKLHDAASDRRKFLSDLCESRSIIFSKLSCEEAQAKLAAHYKAKAKAKAEAEANAE